MPTCKIRLCFACRDRSLVSCRRNWSMWETNDFISKIARLCVYYREVMRKAKSAHVTLTSYFELHSVLNKQKVHPFILSNRWVGVDLQPVLGTLAEKREHTPDETPVCQTTFRKPHFLTFASFAFASKANHGYALAREFIPIC